MRLDEDIAFKSDSGFTLIEVLLALTIFAIGILAVITLSDANVRLAKESADRVLVANLAREGIELVRNVRDSNWLKIEDNQTDCGGSDICPWDYRLHAEDNGGFFAIDYTYETTGLLTGCTSWDNCLDSSSALGRIYLNETTGYYSHQPGGKVTNFSRIIKIENLCLANDGTSITETPRSTVCTPGIEEKVGIVVTAKVRYRIHGKTIDFDAVEHLYNWRY
ncbi:MAG: prepilin-type N-terminal cleavage/methylation domain-containing protein [Patescibacteria group bacterium]